MKEIYDFITSQGQLTVPHKNNLMQERGFSDETIKTNRFFSGGKYLLELEEQLTKDFKEENLLESGVMVKSGSILALSPPLLDDRVVIPYLDKDGKAMLIRPHKLGLKGIPIQIYQELNFNRVVVLTEGEFKAAACMQLGIPAIAIPGIGSFSSQHFPKFVQTLNTFGVKDVCVIFDNEVKDDPAFPELYKENPANRYDVQYYAHFMAESLRKEGFRTQIGHLPDGWRKNGKIDLDGALAQEKTRDDIGRIIASSKTDKEYFAEIPKDGQKVMSRKKAKRFFRSNIKKEFGKYYALRSFGTGRQRTEDYIEVSNFIIRIMATHETPENIIREIVFVNEFYEKTKSFSLPPEDMSSSDSFKTFCLSKGNFLWRGRKEELDMIWQSEFLDDDGRLIIEHDHIGWMASEKMWLFGNVAIDNKGNELRPDANRIFWTEKKGIKPLSVDVANGRKEDFLGVPHLNLRRFDSNALLDKLILSIGENEAKMCLGWAFSVFFLEDLFKMFGSFPFLFLSGKRSSGKTRVAEWLINIYGIESEGIQAQDTTSVGLQRYLSYYSSLPVFLDEYRNTDKVTNKNGLIRNAYNRQSAIKGVKSDYGIRQATVRGTMIITGQEPPRDNAILCRCIHILITEKNRNNTDNPFDWFMANKTKFSNCAFELLKRKAGIIDNFKHIFIEARDHFISTGVDNRKSINYATVAAGYAVMFGGDDRKFATYLSGEVKRIHREIDEEEESMVFWEDLLAMRHSSRIKDRYWIVEDKVAYIYFNGLYNEWSADYAKRNKEIAFTARSLKDIIKHEDYCLDVSARRRIGGTLLRCVAIDLEKAPESIVSLVDHPQGDPSDTRGSCWNACSSSSGTPNPINDNELGDW